MDLSIPQIQIIGIESGFLTKEDTLFFTGTNLSPLHGSYHLFVYDSSGDEVLRRWSPGSINNNKVGFKLPDAFNSYQTYDIKLLYHENTVYEASDALVITGTYNRHIIHNNNYCPYSIFRLLVTDTDANVEKYRCYIGSTRIYHSWTRRIEEGRIWAFQLPADIPPGDQEVRLIYNDIPARPLWNKQVSITDGSFSFTPSSVVSGENIQLTISHVTVGAAFHIALTSVATGETVEHFVKGANITNGTMNFTFPISEPPGDYEVKIYFDSYYSESEKYFLSPAMDDIILTVE